MKLQITDAVHLSFWLFGYISQKVYKVVIQNASLSMVVFSSPLWIVEVVGLYVAPILIYIPWHILFKVYCLESLIWVSDDGVQVGPHSVIPDHFLGQGAGKWLWNRLWNRFAEYKSVDCFKTWSKAWFWNK